MTRLCVIGNSHLGALKLAWDTLAPLHSDVTMTFFAAHANESRDLLPQNGRLEPSTEALRAQLAWTSGGRQHVDPGEYDAFLVYGFWIRTAEGETPGNLSSDFVRHVVIERARSGLMYKHAMNLRSISDKPIWCAQSPLASPIGDKGTIGLMPNPTEVALVQTEVLDGIPATLVPQPEETMLNGEMTLPHFAQGSLRLMAVGENSGSEHPQNEPFHMNKDYGEIWLQRFLPRLTGK